MGYLTLEYLPTYRQLPLKALHDVQSSTSRGHTCVGEKVRNILTFLPYAILTFMLSSAQPMDRSQDTMRSGNNRLELQAEYGLGVRLQRGHALKPDQHSLPSSQTSMRPPALIRPGYVCLTACIL